MATGLIPGPGLVPWRRSEAKAALTRHRPLRRGLLRRVHAHRPRRGGRAG
ncbi:hypothetical protein ACRAWD_09565 [Caulobacter segnis]